MITTGRTVQPEALLGRPGAKGSPYGELYVDDGGQPIAVVCHELTVRKPVPDISGLVATREALGEVTRVTYRRKKK